VYHVDARGNERRTIFRDDVDRQTFLATLALAVARYELVCHGYCLMGNHYHLLLETPRANLPSAMRHINGCYTKAFNSRWHRVGHLFQGRYHAVPVEKDGHLVETIRYLALNPIRTKPPLCKRAEQWPWSSYPAALGLVDQPPWLTNDWLLAQFGRDRATARARLRTFVTADTAAGPPKRGIYNASEQFIRRRTRDLEPLAEVPRAHWQPLPPPLDEIFSRAGEPIRTAYRDHGYTLREIADHLGCHYTTVSRRLKRSEAA
jgi:putative transposase